MSDNDAVVRDLQTSVLRLSEELHRVTTEINELTSRCEQLGDELDRWVSIANRFAAWAAWFMGDEAYSRFHSGDSLLTLFNQWKALDESNTRSNIEAK